jgi:hypothetical protein
MQLLPDAKSTNPTLKEASGNHDARSAAEPAPFTTKDFDPWVCFSIVLST